MSLACQEIDGDMAEIDYDILPIEDEVKEVVQEQMFKYSDADFDPIKSRLHVPRRVEFVKRLSSIEGNPIGKCLIENTSNLPMTYKIVPLDLDYPMRIFPQKITTSPGMGFIAPRSVAVLEIRLGENDSEMAQDPSLWTRMLVRFVLCIAKRGLPYSGVFAIYGAPIFRQEHAQETKLELFWKGFGTDVFPYSHAEVHESEMAVSPVKMVGDDQYKIHARKGGYDLNPPKWIKKLEHASAEEFNSLWTAGDDPNEYNSCLEFRLKELQRVAKRRDIPHEYDLFERILCLLCCLLLIALILPLLIFGFPASKGPGSDSSGTQSTFNETVQKF